MKWLYFLPRYDASLLGNRIHTEVIDIWRRYGITTEVAALSAQVKHLTTTEQDGIVVHQLPVGANLPIKLANKVAHAIWHYPYLAGAAASYRKLLRQRRYDLVHVETVFPLGMVASSVPRSQHPPLAITIPGADIMAEPDYDYGYARFFGVRSMLPFIMRRADVLRADSPQIHSLAVRLGAPPEKITTIPYNITADSFLPEGTNLATFRSESRTLIAERHGFTRDTPVVVSVNRLHPFKGFIHLIEALPYIHHHGVFPKLLIVGPNRTTPQFGDYGQLLLQRAQALGVADDVIFVGSVEHSEVIRYYAAADVGAVASVAESFSRVAIEIAAAGTPVLITKTTGASDYIAAAQCGQVVPPRDPEALGSAIATMVNDQAAGQRYHANTIAFAQGFSSSSIAEQIYCFYKDSLI